MVGDCKHLNRSIDVAINDVKVKNLEHGPSNVGCQNNA